MKILVNPSVLKAGKFTGFLFLSILLIKFVLIDSIDLAVSYLNKPPPPLPPPVIVDTTPEYYGSKEIGFNRELKQIVYTVFKNQRNSSRPYLDGLGEEMPVVLFLALINDKTSYGKNRKFSSMVDMIKTMAYPPKLSEISLLIADPDEFDAIQEYVDENYPEMPFAKITLLSDDQDRAAAETERDQRHYDWVQKNRRRKLAMLRNRLAYSTLTKEHDGMFWIDVDVYEAPKHLVRKLAMSGLDIATPICLWGEYDWVYDANTWSGKRIKPTEEDLEKMRRGEDSGFVPRPLDGNSHLLSEFRVPGIDYVELDSVGGTMLYIRSEVFLNGVNFPPFYVIGAEWEMKEGWDGIETEGLCYIAKTMGYKCWGFPNLVIRHELEDIYREQWGLPMD